MPPIFTEKPNGFESIRGIVHRSQDGHTVIVVGGPEKATVFFDSTLVGHVDESLKQVGQPVRIKVEYGEE